MELTYDIYSLCLKTLRPMIKEEFSKIRPNTWKYAWTGLWRMDEIGYERIGASPNAVALLQFESKYASTERGGWVSYSEYAFLNSDGTFTEFANHTILIKVLPTWLNMICYKV
jgi:hypothetical protein